MDLLRTMGASRLQLLLRVRLPSALPQFFTGLKVSITFSFVSAILAEYVGATQGPASTCRPTTAAFETTWCSRRDRDRAVDAAFVRLVVALERLSMPWRRPAQIDTRW